MCFLLPFLTWHRIDCLIWKLKRKNGNDGKDFFFLEVISSTSTAFYFPQKIIIIWLIVYLKKIQYPAVALLCMFVCLYHNNEFRKKKKNERKLTWVASLISRKTDDFTMSGSHFFCYSEKQSMQFVKSTFPSRIEPCNLIHRLYKKKIYENLSDRPQIDRSLCVCRKKKREKWERQKKTLSITLAQPLIPFYLCEKM